MERNESLSWMIENSSAGSTSAFRLLFNHTRDDLFRFIRKRVNMREDALDILQDSYTDLWQSLKKGQFQYSSDPEFMGFLCLIARRRIVKLYRFYKPKVSLEDLADLPDDTDGYQKGEAQATINALATLGRRDREVMELHYFEGLGFREIASLLETGESAVKVRHHRAINKLKKLLGYEKQE